jgi:hypothetical protein
MGPSHQPRHSLWRVRSCGSVQSTHPRRVFGEPASKAATGWCFRKGGDRPHEHACAN